MNDEFQSPDVVTKLMVSHEKPFLPVMLMLNCVIVFLRGMFTHTHTHTHTHTLSEYT